MAVFDPISLLYTNALVTLVVAAVLWMSRIGMRDGARGARTWIVGDVVLAAARCLTVIDAASDHATLPFGPLVVTGALAMPGLIAHLEALRRLAGRPSRPWALVAQALALTLLAALPLSQIGSISGRTLWINFLLAAMAAITLLALWPLRRLWGARIMGAMMVAALLFFAARLATTMFGDGPQQVAQSISPYRLMVAALLDMMIGLFLSAGFLLLQQERLRERIERLVVTDALTGSLNRHGLMPLLERELARVGRHDRALSVAMFDLDHFKRVNDEHGHPMGDRVLAGFADRVHGMLRSGDLFGRWGGEEFLLVLPETAADAARQVAERIRAGVAGTPLADGAPTVTVSGGVASANEVSARAHDLLHLLDLADKRLYQAKQARNCIVGA